MVIAFGWWLLPVTASALMLLTMLRPIDYSRIGSGIEWLLRLLWILPIVFIWAAYISFRCSRG
jgi:hypothetical protein